MYGMGALVFHRAVTSRGVHEGTSCDDEREIPTRWGTPSDTAEEDDDDGL